MTKSLIISADLQNWGDIYNFIVEYFLKHNISKRDIMGMLVSAEEIFSNIIHHSRINIGDEIEIHIDYDCSNRVMTLNFKYEGIEFNPSEADIPDVNMSFDKRSPGGLGLLIVKRFTDSITYKRSCGKNILEISKKAVDF